MDIRCTRRNADALPYFILTALGLGAYIMPGRLLMKYLISNATHGVLHVQWARPPGDSVRPGAPRAGAAGRSRTATKRPLLLMPPLKPGWKGSGSCEQAFSQNRPFNQLMLFFTNIRIVWNGKNKTPPLLV